MKAMVLTAPGAVALEEIAQPVPGADEALIRVTHSGICGTDFKIFKGGIPVPYPLVMGHESIGEVVSGSKFEPGTRIIVDPVTYCGTCYQCRVGQTQLCPNGGLIGRDVDGGFAEYQLAPADNIHAIPDAIPSEIAALMQPMTTCIHGQMMADIKPGEAVAIIGLGVTGLLHVQIAKALGADPVIGITRSAWKRDLAEELGADVTFAPSDDLVEQVRAVTGDKGGPDVVIESVGSLAVLAQAMDLVRLGGRVMPFGILTQTQGELPFYDFYFKEIQLVNARAAKPADFTASIDYVERGVVKLAPLITDQIPLSEMNRAMEKLEAGEGIKIILDNAA